MMSYILYDVTLIVNYFGADSMLSIVASVTYRKTARQPPKWTSARDLNLIADRPNTR
jgi:hypothetical protein